MASRAIGLFTLLAALAPTAATAADDPATGPDGDPLEISFDVESKLHWRHSDRNALPVPFPFSPDMLPPGFEQGEVRTVEGGSHLELSVISLIGNLEYGDRFRAHAKVDLFDRYDRNPTSGDRRIDLDAFWIEFGRHTPVATVAADPGAYLRIGKFGKFERQNDRHLESYGVVSTAFNRFEDNGIEIGVDLTPNLYLKASITEGNPVFLRDPNALAGDNGVEELRNPNPQPPFETGIPILYDAEVEDVDFLEDPELGLATGFRWEDAAGQRALDIMAFGYRRELNNSVNLEGTFYGGDLDLLRGPANQFPFPGLRGNDKTEYGANVWAYLGDVSLFAQYVDQELASLPRTGYEIEAAWRFGLPLVWAYDGRQLFSQIQPAIRYSRLDNGFSNPDVTPFPSASWDWVKIDYGLRLAILPGLDLTAEFADNRFETASGTRDNDEWLVTLRWRF